MNKYTLMDKINNFEALKACMIRAEDEYVSAMKDNGEPVYVGYEEFEEGHHFMEDCIRTLGEWMQSKCLTVFDAYMEDPSKFGCFEIADSLACLQCGCRNYSTAQFLYMKFEDAREFIQYLIEHDEELTEE